MTDPDPPVVPAGALEEGGWERTDQSVETLFELAAVRIRGATVRYEDERTRERLREATDGTVDHTMRFFAATRLAFEPPLPPGVTSSMVAPTLRSQARKAFADRLRERGLTGVEKGRTERIRVDDGPRAKLTKYTATDPLADGDDGSGETTELPLECWIAIWTGTRDTTIVTGGYPAVALAGQFDLGVDGDDLLARAPSTYRDEFISLVRTVS